MTPGETAKEKRESLASMRAALLAFARRLVDADTAEDLVQEAFMRALTQDHLTPADHPLAYLKVVVRNLAVDAYTRRTRESTLVGRAGLACEQVIPPIETIDEDSRLDADLRERLSELSHRQWESLVLTVVLGLTENEAASAAHVSRSAVNGGRKRAIEWLRQHSGPANHEAQKRLAG